MISNDISICKYLIHLDKAASYEVCMLVIELNNVKVC